jgi:23S rRNA (pseudouridine1915-N3)-methyltransferase
VLGKFKEPGFKQLEEEYLKRLRPYAKMSLVELKEVPYKTPGDAERAKADEAELIRGLIKKDDIVILLDEKGTARSSLEYADFIGRLESLGRELVFVIGSGVGLSSELKGEANHVISLGPMTFTHNFARVLLEEQIYRACTILHNKPYHKI